MVTIPDNIVLAGDEIWDAYENSVDSTAGHWKHGSSETFVFKHQNGHHYRATVNFHPQDGMQTHDPIDAYRVVETQITKTVWMSA